jgi:hypothetical protein
MSCYIIFKYDGWHPNGGARDITSCFNCSKDAIGFAEQLAKKSEDSIHVYDTALQRIIWDSYDQRKKWKKKMLKL